MQPIRKPLAPCWCWFQSSSGQKAGCNWPRQSSRPTDLILFQSSSGQKAGCNTGALMVVGEMLKFQSSSGQKAGCNSIMV